MRCMLVVVEGLYHHHEITGEKLSLSYQIIRGQKLSYCNILYTTICCNFGPGQPRPDGRVKLCIGEGEKGTVFYYVYYGELKNSCLRL